VRIHRQGIEGIGIAIGGIRIRMSVAMTTTIATTIMARDIITTKMIAISENAQRGFTEKKGEIAIPS
jgi:hypothetical protein